MAEEIKNTTNGAAASSGNEPEAEETIDLEGLVRNIEQSADQGTDVASTSVTVSPSAAADEATQEIAHEATSPAPAVDDSFTPAPIADAPAGRTHAEELSPDEIDQILQVEDPELAAQMEAIRGEGFSSNADEIKALEQEDESVQDALHGKVPKSFRARFRLRVLKIQSLVHSTKSLLVRSAKDSKGLARELVLRAKAKTIESLRNRRADLGSGLAWMKSRSFAQKLALLLVLAILAVLAFVATKTLQGTLLPKNEKLWVASFGEHADGAFTYNLEGPFEDFNDPLLHPEFVILIERVVVNLSRTANAADAANPMAAFELYLQTDNQEAAVEIKDRSVEIRDAVARSVERMTYQDLVGEEGKARLKLLIRKDLNEILTKGKVRRVFFKTIVLNPE